MTNPWLFNYNDEENHFDVEEISSMVFAEMCEIAEAYLGSNEPSAATIA